MIFKWENQEDKLVKFMKISPKKKLEWLFQMHELIRKSYTKKQKAIYWKLRENS